MDEKETIIDYVYCNFNTEDSLGLTSYQLQQIHENIRGNTLSMPQVQASMQYICAFPSLCDKEELMDVLREMDRRYFLATDLQWEFAMLDHQRKGSITKDKAMMMFKLVHGNFFSKFKFDRLMKARATPDCDVTFAEIEVELCNIPTYDWIDELLKEEGKESEEREFKRRVEERRQKELANKKKKEEETERQLAEEASKMKAMLAKKAEEEEKQRKAKEEEEKEQARIQAAEQKKLEDEKAAKRERKKQKELELKKKREEQEQKEAESKAKEKEEEMKAMMEAQEKIEKEKRAKEEQEAEQEALIKKAQEDLALKKEKEEYEAELRAIDEAEKEKKKEQAAENWKKAKDLMKEKLRHQRMHAFHEAKAAEEALEAAKEAGNAEEAALAESQAEDAIVKAEMAMEQASSEEEKNNAQEAKVKAESEALKFKEQRLRLTLKAAVKLRNRPRIDVAVIEAKESEIKALKPDIEVAEKTSDSLKCGEELEDAMVKRNLDEIQSSVDKIKSKGYEKDHPVALTEAEKLMEKLKRIEKLKKEILALDQRTISEIRSYKTPNPAIHQIMIATYIILGYKEKELKEWKFIQALLGRTGKEGLKRMCTTIEASKINLQAADLAEKKYLRNHSLESITEISAGAGTFFVWSTAMIEEARSWKEDGEFRQKIEEKRKREEEEAKQLKEKLASKNLKKGKSTNPAKEKSQVSVPKSGGRARSPAKEKKSTMPVPTSNQRSRSGSPKVRKKQK